MSHAFAKTLVCAALLLTLCAFVRAQAAATQAPTPAQTPDAAKARGEFLRSVQEAAREDALADKPIPSALELNNAYRQEAASAGVSLLEVRQAYDEAYKAARDSMPLYVRYRPSLGWVVAILLAVFFLAKRVWSDTVYPRLKDFNDRIYRKHAGRKIFHRKSLRNYRQKLVEEYGKFKPPFASGRELDMSQVYVPLQIRGRSSEKPLDAFDAIAKYRRLMVTGTPGSGKSMLLKRYALSYASRPSTASPDQPVPVLFPLRRLNEDDRPLIEQMASILEESQFPKPQNFIERSLKDDEGDKDVALLLLFDGLDEVNSSKRPEVVGKIKSFLRQYDCWAVITCRTAVYNYEFNEVVNQTLEIQPFTDQDIQSFLYSWRMMPAGKSPQQLFFSLNDKPSIKALARNPLLLTMIVTLYSDLKTFELPYSRADFYKNAVDAFLKLNKFREEPNAYSVPQKRLVLEHLALFNQDSGAVGDQDRISMDFKTIIRETESVLPQLGLAREVSVPLLQEIKDQSGLLIPIDDGTRYQFSHLTLQEYFTASALKDDPAGLIDRFKKDQSAWRETVLLWCGLDHESTQLIRSVREEDSLTAFQCLADAVKIDSGLADSIIDDFSPRLADGDDTVTRTFALVAAGPYERSQKVFNFLSSQLSSSGDRRRLAGAAKALAFTNKQPAAALLARLYDSTPEVRGPLIQMGDLAVAALTGQARRGSVQALNALQTIGTPKAATALLQFLWTDDSDLMTPAARRLATLFTQENVLEELRKQPLGEEQRVEQQFNWVWEPFDEPADSALPVIAGRMVFLINLSDHRDKMAEGLYMDARIAIPVALLHQLSAHLGINDFTQRVITAAGGGKSHTARLGLLPMPDAEGRTTDAPAEDLADLLAESPDAAVAKFIRILMATPPGIRGELSSRLLRSPEPTVDDWMNIRKPIAYNFKGSWHLRLVHSLAVVVTFVALLGIAYSFGRPAVSWANVARALSIVVCVFIWTIAYFCWFAEAFNVIPVLFLGPLVYVKDILETIGELPGKDSGDVTFELLVIPCMLSFFPICIYFASSFFLRELPWGFVLSFWLVVGVLMVFLWRTGRRRERAARNPLFGLLDTQTREDLKA
jgi:NACHT domain